MRLTRRAFLGALAATTSALALDPLITSASVRGRALPVAPRGSAPRIAIVGAGIAGLSAALALRDRGVSSVVYEAQSRVGGRMHSERAFWDNGQVSEYGGELIDTSHTTIRKLAKRFDLPLADVLAGVPAACEETIFEAGSYYTQHDLYADFRAFYPIISAHVRDAGFATTFAHSTPTGRALDAMHRIERATRWRRMRERRRETGVANVCADDGIKRAKIGVEVVLRVVGTRFENRLFASGGYAREHVGEW